MKSLERVRVLWVASEASDPDHHTLWLRSEGAELQICAWPDLTTEAQRVAPAVIVADLRTGHQHEGELAKLQALPAFRALPVVAVVLASASSAAQLPSGVRISKYLTAPFHPSDLVNAIAGLGPASPRTPSSVEPSVTFESLIGARVERRDLRGVLALLNATGPFRYTAILRLDEQRLTSIWTFDRDNPEVDGFPLDMTIGGSYCSRVIETQEPFSMPDAAAEPTVQNHPARHSVLAYCGVPLQRADGSVFGTLCQFDVVPRFFGESTVRRLAATADLLRPHLSWLSGLSKA